MVQDNSTHLDPLGSTLQVQRSSGFATPMPRMATGTQPLRQFVEICNYEVETSHMDEEFGIPIWIFIGIGTQILKARLGLGPGVFFG